MKVSELIKALEKYNPNDIVILASDAEGNGFSPLDDMSEDMYWPETAWNGSTHIRELTPELQERGFTEEDLAPKDQSLPCITLWPVN